LPLYLRRAATPRSWRLTRLVPRLARATHFLLSAGSDAVHSWRRRPSSRQHLRRANAASSRPVGAQQRGIACNAQPTLTLHTAFGFFRAVRTLAPLALLTYRRVPRWH